MHRFPTIALLALPHLLPRVPNAQSRRDAGRGELLYPTHCIACHSIAMPWRDNRKAVTGWDSLQRQAEGWQGITGLGGRRGISAQWCAT